MHQQDFSFVVDTRQESKGVITKKTSAQVELPPFCRSLSAVVHSQFMDEITNVLLRRGHCNRQLPRNFLIGRSGSDQLQYFKLTLAERLDGVIAGRRGSRGGETIWG